MDSGAPIITWVLKMFSVHVSLLVGAWGNDFMGGACFSLVWCRVVCKCMNVICSAVRVINGTVCLKVLSFYIFYILHNLHSEKLQLTRCLKQTIPLVKVTDKRHCCRCVYSGLQSLPVTSICGAVPTDVFHIKWHVISLHTLLCLFI